MAKIPAGSKLIYNPSSAAPGFMIKNVISLPGVPSILNSMIENCKKYLKSGLKIHSTTLNIFTVESQVSKDLSRIQKKYIKKVDIGSYPFFRLGKVGVSIVSRSVSKSILSKVKKELKEMIKRKKLKFSIFNIISKMKYSHHIFDVGAFNGLDGIALAIQNNHTMVHAFEANPAMIKVIIDNKKIESFTKKNKKF